MKSKHPLSPEQRKLLAKLGSKGGKKTLKVHGKKHFSEAGKKGMKKRWAKNKKINKKKHG